MLHYDYIRYTMKMDTQIHSHYVDPNGSLISNTIPFWFFSSIKNFLAFQIFTNMLNWNIFILKDSSFSS